MSGQPNLTIENRLRSYLDKKAKLSVDSHAAHFYRWQKQMLQSVIVDPTGRIEGVQQLIAVAEKSNYLEPKHCYDNAVELTISSLGMQEASYVEGFIVIDGTLFGHAWNSMAGRYFDYTSDLVNAHLVHQGIPLPTRHFLKVIELPIREVYPHMLSEDEASLQVRHFLKQNCIPPSASNIDWNIIPSGEPLP